MYSVIDQLRCSDTDTDDSGDGDNGHFDLNVNASIQRWVPFFIFFFVYYSVTSAAIRERTMNVQ